jgi:hypothetical protein
MKSLQSKMCLSPFVGIRVCHPKGVAWHGMAVLFQIKTPSPSPSAVTHVPKANDTTYETSRLARTNRLFVPEIILVHHHRLAALQCGHRPRKPHPHLLRQRRPRALDPVHFGL